MSLKFGVCDQARRGGHLQLRVNPQTKMRQIMAAIDEYFYLQGMPITIGGIKVEETQTMDYNRTVSDYGITTGCHLTIDKQKN